MTTRWWWCNSCSYGTSIVLKSLLYIGWLDMDGSSTTVCIYASPKRAVNERYPYWFEALQTSNSHMSEVDLSALLVIWHNNIIMLNNSNNNNNNNDNNNNNNSNNVIYLWCATLYYISCAQNLTSRSAFKQHPLCLIWNYWHMLLVTILARRGPMSICSDIAPDAISLHIDDILHSCECNVTFLVVRKCYCAIPRRVQ